MTSEELAARIALGHEQSGVEFKGPCDLKDKWMVAKVIRACLGMANRRDGGYVILGALEKSDNTLEAVGLTPQQLSDWSDHDRVIGHVNQYARPSIDLETITLEVAGKTLVVIHVQEFESVPILCGKELTMHIGGKPEQMLRKGGCYVRSKRKPETTEIPEEEDMRALLDVATRKALQQRLKELGELGLVGQRPPEPESPSDDALYNDELKGIR